MSTTALDQIMEQASAALADMRYLECEALCTQALSRARQGERWAYYGRILMPLQECRRQRRMIAAEGHIQLGSTHLPDDPEAILEHLGTGCIVLTHPHNRATARQLHALAIERQRCVEVLFADSAAGDDRWKLSFWQGPEVAAWIEAPPPAWRDQRLAPDAYPADDAARQPAPGNWFLRASERLGDAALEQLGIDRLDQPAAATVELADGFADALQVVTDHELVHQALGRVVRQLALRRGGKP